MDITGALKRLHQEDLVQALGGVSLLKYQQDGGPSLADVAGVLREHTARPLEALSRLRDWQILNCLIGNWDGHGKNLALLYEPGEPVPSLAPFYDLVAIEFLNLVKPGSWARDMALAVGEHAVPEKIGRSDWEAFAGDLGMPPRRVLARVEELAETLPGIAADVRDAFAENHGDEAIYYQLVESVRRRCKWTLQSIGTRRPS
jgi:serine/threonine-protein kinase HipA